MDEQWKEFDNYYKIKKDYEQKIKDKLHPIIIDSALTKSEKHRRYNNILGRIKVKKIFSNEGRVLKVVENDKKVIEYKNPYYNVYETSAQNYSNWDNDNKESIMRLKLDVLFNYIDEENSMKEFELLKKEIKEDLTEYSKIIAEIYAIENSNKELIINEKDKLYEGIQDFKTKLATKTDGCEREAIEIYSTQIEPATKEAKRLQYDKGFREVTEELKGNNTYIYQLITEPFSILSKEFSNDVDEEEIKEKLQKKADARTLKDKRKHTGSSLDVEHEKIASITEELGQLMVEYSSLVRKEKDTTDIQQIIDEKQAALKQQRELVDTKMLKHRQAEDALDIRIPEQLGPYERQKYIQNLPERVRQRYIDNMLPYLRKDYVENLKKHGPDMIKKNYDKKRESMSDAKYKKFLLKELMKEQKMSKQEAQEVLFFLQVYEDYYKYHYDYDLFPDEDLTRDQKLALDMKEKLEKRQKERAEREEKLDKLKFTRDGTIPPWGTAELYKDKLNIGDKMYVTKEKVTIYEYSGENSSSEVITVEDYVNHPFQVNATMVWGKDVMKNHIPGQDKEQVMIQSKLDSKIKGWVNYKDVYTDINPNPDEEVNATVVLSAPADEEHELAVSLEDIKPIWTVAQEKRWQQRKKDLKEDTGALNVKAEEEEEEEEELDKL